MENEIKVVFILVFYFFFFYSKQFGFDRLIIAKYYVLESAYFLKTN